MPEKNDTERSEPDSEEALATTPCSPFDLLMGQIEAMRDRSEKYYKESQEEETAEGDRDAEKQFAIMMVLKELHRLGKHFEANK